MHKQHHLSDIELIELSKNGDEQSFSLLYDRYKMITYKHAYLFYQDYDAAQDVTQDVFMKLWAQRERIKITTDFAAYLHIMVRHHILNQLAHQKVVQKFQDFIEHRPSLNNDVDEYILGKELKGIIDEKINKLPKKMKQVFLLSREDHLSHQEISEQLKISTKTVRQQIYNALLLIKSNLKYMLVILFS